MVVALPPVREAFDAPADATWWIIGAYALCLSALGLSAADTGASGCSAGRSGRFAAGPAGARGDRAAPDHAELP
ncbi:hypothetical protein ACFV4N_38685 [Actinosynnema sp. NPDC059797]